jgi:hypothetical protein
MIVWIDQLHASAIKGKQEPTTAGNALYADITSPGTNTHIAVVYVEV